mmetsp:Transcript_8186/g.26033  ORF Transcript_8186/g.26033 Transcript_8186/m.26033 type:complete len:229 (+) Transcript_8186:730-1416(+)
MRSRPCMQIGHAYCCISVGAGNPALMSGARTRWGKATSSQERQQPGTSPEPRTSTPCSVGAPGAGGCCSAGPGSGAGVGALRHPDDAQQPPAAPPSAPPPGQLLGSPPKSQPVSPARPAEGAEGRSLASSGPPLQAKALAVEPLAPKWEAVGALRKVPAGSLAENSPLPFSNGRRLRSGVPCLLSRPPLEKKLEVCEVSRTPEVPEPVLWHEPSPGPRALPPCKAPAA